MSRSRCLYAPCTPRTRTVSTQPNLLIIMCDELRAQGQGYYGHPTIQTPHLDHLAQTGAAFEHAVSNCPICMPARSAVLSGQYARTCTGMLNNTVHRTTEGGWIMPQWPSDGRKHLPDPTLPEILRNRGYQTAAIGKWHVECWPDAIGFDHYNIPAHQHAHSAQWFCEDGGPPLSPPGYSVDYEADRVCAYLEKQANQDAPFFLYYNISPPHMPLADAPEKYLKMYSRDDVVLRDNVDLDTPLPRQTQQFLTYLWDYRYYRDHLPYTRDLPPGFDLRDLIALYMGLTTWVDDTAGRVLDKLKQLSLEDDTTVVFTSDHGDNLGSHQIMGKGTLNEESIRIPMHLRGPGIANQKISQQVGSLVDLAPTLLELAGIQPPSHMQGRSLAPVLKGDRPCLDEPWAYIETEKDGIGLRTPDRMIQAPWSTAAPQIDPTRCLVTDLTQDPYQLAPTEVTPSDSNDLTEQIHRLHRWHENTPWKTPH